MNVWFIRTGVVYLMLGLIAGGGMHHQHSTALLPLHAYLCFAGGFQLVVGILYRVYSRAGLSRLAVWQYWLFNVPMVFAAAYMMWAVSRGRTFDDSQPHTNDPLLGLLGVALVASLVTFAVNSFRNIDSSTTK